MVLDIDVKPNRGDALSLIGLAREVAAISGTRVRWPVIEVPESGDSTDEHLWVEVADKRLCPRFVGRYVDKLKIGPSPVCRSSCACLPRDCARCRTPSMRATT